MNSEMAYSLRRTKLSLHQSPSLAILYFMVSAITSVTKGCIKPFSEIFLIFTATKINFCK